jgi:hypothetical protein
MKEMILPVTMIQFPSNLHLRILLQLSCSMGGHVHGEVAAQIQKPLVAAFLLDTHLRLSLAKKNSSLIYLCVVIIIKCLRRTKEEGSTN